MMFAIQRTTTTDDDQVIILHIMTTNQVHMPSSYFEMVCISGGVSVYSLTHPAGPQHPASRPFRRPQRADNDKWVRRCFYEVRSFQCSGTVTGPNHSPVRHDVGTVRMVRTVMMWPNSCFCLSRAVFVMYFIVASSNVCSVCQWPGSSLFTPAVHTAGWRSAPAVISSIMLRCWACNGRTTLVCLEKYICWIS